MFLFQVLATSTKSPQNAVVNSIRPADIKNIKAESITKDADVSSTLIEDLNKILKDSKNVDKTVIVYFGAETCEPCKMLVEKDANGGDSPVEKMLKSLDRNKYVFVKIDVSLAFKEEGDALVQTIQRFGEFQKVPAFLRYDVNLRDLADQKIFDDQKQSKQKGGNKSVSGPTLRREAQSKSKAIVAPDPIDLAAQILKN